MPARTPDDLFALFEALGIQAETHRHPAVFTVAESRPVKDRIPGAHSKNLFLKDKRDRLFLVVARDDAAIDLKRLHGPVGGSGRLSFGSADLLRETLGVEPGSVTPFAVVNDAARRVSVVLDEGLMRHDRLNFHPLRNTMTTGISGPDLLRFLAATDHEPRIVTLPVPLCGADGQQPSS